MRIEIADGKKHEQIVRLSLVDSGAGDVIVYDIASGMRLGAFSKYGFCPTICAHDTALPTDKRGRIKIIGYTPDDEIEDQNPWIPVNGLSEIPEEFKDGRDVEVTCYDDRLVRVVEKRETSWFYSGTIKHFNGDDYVTAYRIPKPYKEA